MKKSKKARWLYKAAGMAALFGAIFSGNGISQGSWQPGLLSVFAEERGGSLSSVTEEAKILPIPDSNGKYMLKSDGFYCLNEDGSGDCTPAIHYFDHFVVDGAVFDGYYYHDETGKFKAAKTHLVSVSQEALPKREDEALEDGWTPGIYAVNNLGKISGTGRVCFLKEEVAQTKLDGYYYIDKNGRVCLEGGIYYIQEMRAGEKLFSGYYYFNESDGTLAEEEGTTPEGLTIQKDGSIKELTSPGIRNLKKAVKDFTEGLEGDWSVYVKDLKSGEKFSINDRAMSSASLIKAFTMAASYDNMEEIRANEGVLLKAAPDSGAVADKLFRLMENMVTYSDNESFNEMVRLQTASNQFNAGARAINRYLREQGYKETAVLHTLAPSNTEPVGLGSSNTTSVEDCGTLLERIYRGECVSQENSGQMLSLLLNQDTRTKIPGGIKESVQIANKTGENDKSQHDIAIVYGDRTDYILCVMSENAGKEEAAVSNIQRISAMVYNYLNW